MKDIILTVEGNTSDLEGKTFQVHVITKFKSANGGCIIRLIEVKIPSIDDRCPVIIGGEQCCGKS